MQQTTLKEWGITRNQPEVPYLTYSIYEDINSNFAFYFSQIEEWGMMKYCATLQIYQDKLAPKKVYDSGPVWFLFNIFDETTAIYDWTFDKLVCLRQLISHGDNTYSCPFMIIDLSKLTYTLIHDDQMETLEKDPLASIRGIKTVIDKNTKEEKKIAEIINLENLKWVKLPA